MRHKTKIFILILICGALMFLAYFARQYLQTKACSVSLGKCETYVLNLGLIQPMQIFLPYLLGVLVILFFTSKKVLQIWSGFAAGMLILFAFGIANAPIDDCSGWFPCFEDKVSLAHIYSFLFAVISGIVIISTSVFYYVKKRNETKANIQIS